LLTATFKNLHIENSKTYKRRYCPHHIDFMEIGGLAVVTEKGIRKG